MFPKTVLETLFGLKPRVVLQHASVLIWIHLKFTRPYWSQRKSGFFFCLMPQVRWGSHRAPFLLGDSIWTVQKTKRKERINVCTGSMFCLSTFLMFPDKWRAYGQTLESSGKKLCIHIISCTYVCIFSFDYHLQRKTMWLFLYGPCCDGANCRLIIFSFIVALNTKRTKKR